MGLFAATLTSLLMSFPHIFIVALAALPYLVRLVTTLRLRLVQLKTVKRHYLPFM